MAVLADATRALAFTAALAGSAFAHIQPAGAQNWPTKPITIAVAERRREGPARLVGGDAARLPFRDRCFDLSLCLFVSHHLDDEELRRALRGLARVTSGALVFADAVRNDRRAVSRWLWNYDRGRHPRTEETITGLLRESFNLSEVARFSGVRLSGITK